jgi:NAD(P)H-hydrate epimerase
MESILTPAEMAEADRRTIAAGTPVEVLMDRAGHAVAWEVRQRLGRTYGARVVVVCGKGNNGGDGLVAARVLRGWGVRVEVLELAHGIPTDVLDRAIGHADVLVDGMFGTGFRGGSGGGLEGDAVQVARASRRIPTIAIDIPSGVDGLTGAVTGDAVQAVSTVTFAARKPGLCFEPGRSHAGEARVADIGIDIGSSMLGLTERADVREWLDVDTSDTWNARSHRADMHKWRSGLLVIGGSDGMTGAPMMSSRAAMRSGAGIVWLGLPGASAVAHTAGDHAAGSEVITKAMPATDEGALSGISDDVRDAIGRFRAVAIGPGLGTAEATRTAVLELVTGIPVPMVLDADGLNALAGHAERLLGRPAPTVLTPHEGEYARLVGEPVGIDRVAAARTLAQQTGCVVLLKGPGTVIAEPGGRVAVNPIDGPWLATAGSGDVLTGIVGGFLARGLGAFEAAAAGAFVHGLAADAAGHTGLVAGDLVDALPRVLAELSGP